MSNQKKIYIEKGISETENTEIPQLLAHMPEVISTYRIDALIVVQKKEIKERM